MLRGFTFHNFPFRGFATLVLFQLIGETIIRFTHAPIPSAVIGMLLLFLTLQLSNRELPIWLGTASHSMIRWLSLMFVPACVGLFFLPNLNINQWFAVGTVIFLATLITIIATALFMNKLMSDSNKVEVSDHE